MKNKKHMALKEGMIVESVYTAYRYKIESVIDSEWVEGLGIDEENKDVVERLKTDCIRIVK